MRLALSTASVVVFVAALGTGCKASPADRSDGTLPQLKAQRFAKGVIRLDGKADEAAWQTTGTTGEFVRPGDGKPSPHSPVAARAKIGWDAEHLYLAISVDDANPTSPFSPKDKDPHVWARASGIELMVQPGDPGNNSHYYEVQLDVKGAVWDTRFDDYNRPITTVRGRRRFGHQSWAAGLTYGISRVPGKGYQMELALPFAALNSPTATVPPRAGETWRINIYSFRDGQRHALAWSPLLGRGNFHKAERFGRVLFSD